MNNITLTKIPIPNKILKGEWYGTVYAIDTESESIEDHNNQVAESIKRIINDFNSKSHHTVSLREVKHELVLSDVRFKRYCTLAQFRVRDSY